tara:strand:+ start:1080 stop:1529 length:450 start_codon:yes stop_codon:yes gene_type:complete
MQALILKTSVAAGVAGIGYFALKRALHADPHPLVMEHAAAVARAYPSLALELTPLAQLAVETDRVDAFVGLLRTLEAVRSEDVNPTLASQHRIQRLSTHLQAQAHALAQGVSPRSSESTHRLQFACLEDTLPQLERHMDTVLHNHILSR